jgi:uncharacterized LabA/DUF88 family protein
LFLLFDLYSVKKKGKLHGKSAELRKQAAKASELKEIIELNKRISHETPPSGVSRNYNAIYNNNI